MWPIVRTFAVIVALGQLSVISGHFLNEWAVQVTNAEDADRIANELNCINAGPIIEGYHLFKHKHVVKRSVDPHHEAHTAIVDHAEVLWAEQQKVLSRKKRQLWRIPRPQMPPQGTGKYVDKMHLNDQRWPQMWYLNRGNKLDMNVQEAWLSGATGKGVSITILDDGIERTHPDLLANYDPLASYDVNENDGDPTPRYDLIDSNRHGTRCAGEVAATANNSECAVGIAYEAGIGGVRMLDGDVTDSVEARSLQLNNQHVAIYSASWGPDDDGKTVDGPGRMATQAFLQGIAKGRGGKGSIFVWASGNGGRDHDNCNCDGYTNSVWTLSVSSATENGLIPWYSEACSSTLASTFSSGSSGERKVVTTDLHHTCTSSHTGTSASAPLAAGIVAMCLQVNKELNWRDVQHLTVRCAHVANLRATDWAVNGVGRNFSHSFGYGIMDAACMVDLARKWRPIPDQKKCSRSADRIDLIIPGKSVSKASINIAGCENEVAILEHVQAQVTLSSSKRGDVIIYLISPSGTRSNLIAKRPRDYSRSGFQAWPFLTVHMWGESPAGEWTLEVHNDGRSVVELKEWTLSFLGTPTPPQPDDVPPIGSASPSPSPKSTNKDSSLKKELDSPIVNIPEQPSLPVAPPGEQKALAFCADQSSPDWCDVCHVGFKQHNGRCVETCPLVGYYLGMEKRAEACVPCYYSCETCTGPNDYQCLSCYGDATLETLAVNQNFCYNKSLIERVFSSSRWYYVLSISALLNFVIVVILVVYILRWKNSRSRMAVSALRGVSSSGGAKRKYSPVKAPDTALLHGHGNRAGAKPGGAAAVPFHDYDSSSDEELLRKPFKD